MDPGQCNQQGNQGCMSPGGLEQGTGFAPPQHEPSTPSQGSRHSQHGSGQGCGRTTGCAPTFPPGFAQQSQGNTVFQQQMQQRPPIVEQQAFLQQNGQNGQSFQQQTAQMPGQGPVWYGAGWMPRGPNVGMAPSFAGCGPRGPCPSSCPNPNFVGGPMPSGQAPSGMGCGSQLGGMSPSMSNLQNVLGLIGSWSDEELLALQSHLSDRFVTVQQRRMIPERFGARLDGSSTVDPFVPTLGGGALPIPGQPGSVGGGQVGSNQDIFAKSEKWLAPAPVPSSTQWRTREEEVYQWGNYLDELTAWAAQASLEFSVEIQHASRWPREITWNSLSVAQQARSRRLLAIVRAAFVNRPRCAALIGVFCEGVSLTSVSGVMGLSSQPANGFELIRQLTLEFSIRSRAEALSLRASLVAKSFTLTAQETTPGSVVSDTIRKLDYEMSRFSKLLGTLPSHIDTNGLRIGEADLLLILLKSLPESVKQYCLHHSGGESYDSYRHAARRWEEQQRLFGEFGPMNSNGNKKVSSVGQTVEETEYHDMTQGDDMLHAVGSDGVAKCSKCGSRKHNTSQCTVDLSKTKCFKCGSFGHVGMNCSQNKDGKGKGKKGVIKSDNWNKGKGQPGKGKGKKGKLNEVSEDSSWDWSNWTEYGGSAEDQWWHNDDASWWDGSWNTGDGSSTQ